MLVKKLKKTSFLSSAAFVGSGGGGGGFSPSSLSPTLWLEASQSTIFSDNGSTQITNGGSIQQWNDKSTNARVLNETVALVKPIWNSATNPFVTFDGSAQGISGGFNLNLYAGGSTISITVRGTGGSTNADVFNGSQDNNNTNTLYRPIRASSGLATTWSPFLRNDAGTIIEADGDVSVAGAFLTTTDTVLTITDDGSGNQVLYLNQTNSATHTYTRAGTFTTNVWSLGAINRPSGAWPTGESWAAFWGGRIYGIVVCTSVLNNTDRTNLITYMGALAGLSI